MYRKILLAVTACVAFAALTGVTSSAVADEPDAAKLPRCKPAAGTNHCLNAITKTSDYPKSWKGPKLVAYIQSDSCNSGKPIYVKGGDFPFSANITKSGKSYKLEVPAAQLDNLPPINGIKCGFLDIDLMTLDIDSARYDDKTNGTGTIKQDGTTSFVAPLSQEIKATAPILGTDVCTFGSKDPTVGDPGPIKVPLSTQKKPGIKYQWAPTGYLDIAAKAGDFGIPGYKVEEGSGILCFAVYSTLNLIGHSMNLPLTGNPPLAKP